MSLLVEKFPALQCAVCLDLFEDPVVLSACGHSFCRVCTEKCRPRGCPLCREPIGREALASSSSLQLAVDEAIQSVVVSAPAEQLEEWGKQQRSVPKGLCLCCEEYHAVDGFCSSCSRAVRSLVPERPLTDIFALVSLSALREAGSKFKESVEAKVACNRASLFARLDGAVGPAVMKSRLFAHLIRSLQAETAVTSPEQLAQLLSSLGHPILSAAQAGDVIMLLRTKGQIDYKVYHVLCCRVIDQWNLTNEPHSIGHCYYGYHETDALERLVYPTQEQTFGAALCQLFYKMQSFGPLETQVDGAVRDFVMGLVRKNRVAEAFEAHRRYQRFVFRHP